jgi:hypothetical protein
VVDHCAGQPGDNVEKGLGGGLELGEHVGRRRALIESTISSGVVTGSNAPSTRVGGEAGTNRCMPER